MTHEPEEMIHDLKAIEETFMEENDGCSPVCLSYAVAAIKRLAAYEAAMDEIKSMPIECEHGEGIIDCLAVIAKHLEKAFEGE